MEQGLLIDELTRQPTPRDECSAQKAIEIIGDRWSLLIVREVFYGVRRFQEFQRNLNVARNILTHRLNRLIDHGVLVRIPLEPESKWGEYRLTDMGRELFPILIGLLQWGDRWLQGGLAGRW